MDMGKRVKKLTVKTALCGIALLIFSQSSFGQIVERRYWSQTYISREYRPRWSDRYENFGNYDLRKYPRSRKLEAGYAKTDYVPNIVWRGNVTPVAYDPFGNLLLPGGEIFSMNWNRSKLGASEWIDEKWATKVFNNLMICSDEFSNWQTRFMLSRGGLGAGIRAYFTPSTLKLTNFGGFRWDASSRKNNVTLLASAGDRPILGLHWQSQLGDILKIGATYVSRKRGTISYSHQDIDGSITEGISAYLKHEPQYIYVLITDDSPEDTGPGARFYGIKAYINGEERPIDFHNEYGDAYLPKGRVFKIPDLFTQKRYYQDSFQKQYVFSYSVGRSSDFLHRPLYLSRNKRGSWLLELLDEKTTTGQRILSDLFHKSGEAGAQGLLNITKERVTGNPQDRFDPDVGNGNKEYLRYFKADFSQGYIEAKNSDLIVVEILVPKGTRQLQFNVNVANDYCIDIIAPLISHRQNKDVGWSNWYAEPLSEDWKGRWSIASYDSKHCKKAPGNVKDGSNQRWVKIEYDRLTGMNVYGMDMELNWRGLFVRAEFNENNTFWSYPLNHALSGGKKNKYTSRAWFVNAEKDFGKWSVGAELFNYPNEYMQYWAPIDDNDDDDYRPGYDAFADEYRSNSYDNYVVYGDFDFDRYFDTEWRGDAYLHYFYDSVTAGDDFNHNGTIDARENDMQIDLPYDRDSKGQHYFLQIRPKEASILTFGHYDVRQRYHEGRNFTRYMKFEHFQRIKGIGEFLFYNRTERIKDNYHLDEGHHNLINNLQTRNVLSTRLTFIPNTNIINNASFTTSYAMGDQRRTDGTLEENIMNLLQIYHGDRRVKRYGGYSYTLEHKIDYTLRVADFRLIPQVKVAGFRLWREKRIKELKFMPMLKVVHSHSYTRPNNFDIYWYDRKTRRLEVYPIVRFDYQVAPKTKLRFGIQGFPGFPEMYRVRSQSAGKLYDYDRRRLILAFENQTLYEGFNLQVLMGVRFSKTKYIHDISKIDPGATEYFITLMSESSG